MSTSQTLSRGLAALELIALAERPPTIEEVSSELAVHRSIAYRIIRTLEAHHLVRRDDGGRCHPDVRLAALGRFARPTVQTIAADELPGLADRLGMTCFLVVRDGDEALTLDSAEPTASRFHVAYRPGIRHPVDRGAPGLAILAGSPAEPDERVEVAEARSVGWVTTSGEVIPGMSSIAVPGPGVDAALASVFLGEPDLDRAAIVATLAAAADRIVQQLGQPAAETAATSDRRAAALAAESPVDVGQSIADRPRTPIP
ncbi:MAG: helix-turn-helix domain-containing protein [Actinomycetota bacterium]